MKKDFRVFVRKKTEFNNEAIALKNELNEFLKLSIDGMEIYNIYDIFNLEESLLDSVKNKILSETVTDLIYDEIDLIDKVYFATEFLPGQFDQRAESAKECLSLITPASLVSITSGKLYVFNDLAKEDLNRVIKYLLNPLEMRLKDLNNLALDLDYTILPFLEFHDFTGLEEEALNLLYKRLNLAMTYSDFKFIQKYFIEEKREPNEAEIRMLDTYWSDHCRHTTFETEIVSVNFGAGKLKNKIEDAFSEYLKVRKELKRETKPLTLMDLATINSRLERFNGNLKDLEVSEENNAASIYADINFTDGTKENYLIMFKNETHNHPTEIEPFGGAATCLGGAIRDPLSGRSYVYQAMRITGAADVTTPLEKTLPGKLPQRIISKKAALGFSSYGNQIGLATTFVKEIYHEGYLAKRLEAGVTVGAANKENVVRKSPVKGDKVILVGGKTGRDGIGGATGSSKTHTEKSLTVSSAEVQKGNAPEERKLQRLMRNPSVTKLIKKANDFGAGGVSVAVGEIAPSIRINLDNIPLKYQGLNAMEILLSESQERMAFVVSENDVKEFITFANKENLLAVEIAEITDDGYLTVVKNNNRIVHIKRDFLDTNGVRGEAKALLALDNSGTPFKISDAGKTLKEKLLNNLNNLNHSSQRGLKEMFDSTIGATTVLMPYGGKYQLTETPLSIQLLPHLDKVSTTCTLLSYGYNPNISSFSPFLGSQYAVIESLGKIIAAGGNLEKVRFSFQEFFERLTDEAKWGKPLEALLGAFKILKDLKLAAIGGKDSMSGTFKDLHVPPTLISFAICTEEAKNIISNELKGANNYLYLLKMPIFEDFSPDLHNFKENASYLENPEIRKNLKAASALEAGGISKTLFNMALGNAVGFEINLDDEDLFKEMPGSFILESSVPLTHSNLILLGKTTSKNMKINNFEFSFKEALEAFERRLEGVFPNYPKKNLSAIPLISYDKKMINKKVLKKEVKVLLPVFPGTNCCYDTEKAFKRHGAKCEILVFNNLNSEAINNSINLLADKIKSSDILVFSGGFSAGDEPDGSGKFIANIINQEKIKKAIFALLERNGLILGICNGFQALVKSGLLPEGKIGEVKEDCPTLFHNDLGRHISKLTQTRYTGAASPWLASFKTGDLQNVALSHGEGKFYASKETLDKLVANGQIAFQYTDPAGMPTYEVNYNPNGSLYAIEGIISPCGKILGKMGHSERSNPNLYKNYPANVNQDIFLNAVRHFTEEKND